MLCAIGDLAKASSQCATIRGASSSIDSPGGDQAVALFIDDVFQGATGDFDPDLFDIERIEVLRGPQGTLFGRNVVGGAIRIVTRQPTQEPYAFVEAGIGNYSSVYARGSVSGALTNDISALLSFSSRSRDGTSFNRTTGRRVDSNERDSLRARLLFEPSADFELTLSGDYAVDNSSGSARDFLGPDPTIDELEGFKPDNDERVVDQFRDSQLARKQYGVAANMEIGFSAGEIQSITAFRVNNSFLDPEDALGTPIELLSTSLDNNLKQFSQEVRFVSDPIGPLRLVGGLYYMQIANSQTENLNVNLIPGTIFGDLQQDVFGTSGPSGVSYFEDVTTKSYAAYLQGTIQATERLELIIGGRYTYEVKDFFGSQDVFSPNILFGTDDFSAEFSEDFSSFTPRFSASYDVDNDIMVYGTISKGFKSGGFVIQGSSDASATPYGPETAWNYEVGFKSLLFNRLLQFNVAAFHVKYSDLQVNTTLPSGVTFVANAGKARTNGVEVEASVYPIDGVNIWANYSYLDAKYIDFGDFSGEQMALAPPHSLSAGASLTHEFGDKFLRLQGSYQYKATHLLEPRVPEEQAAFRSGFSNMFNASLALGLNNEQWEVSVWGKNLTNETYTVYGQDLWPFIYGENDIALNGAAVAQANFPRYNEPRTYGVSARFRF